MLAAPLLGFEWLTGAAFATASMVGDLLSSFAKRRLGLQVHAQALGVDQIPEALLPLLLLRMQLDLSGMEIIVIVVAFIALELALSPLLYKLHIRDRPY
jgi:CDP-archaeol synthase